MKRTSGEYALIKKIFKHEKDPIAVLHLVKLTGDYRKYSGSCGEYGRYDARHAGEIKKSEIKGPFEVKKSKNAQDKIQTI